MEAEINTPLSLASLGPARVAKKVEGEAERAALVEKLQIR